MKYIAPLIRIVSLGIFAYVIASGKMMLWLGIFAFSLVIGLMWGRLYCGYVCPMNTLMIPTQWLSRKLKSQTSKVPKWLLSEKIAWILLSVSVGTMLIFKKVLSVNFPILLFFLVLSILVTLRYEPYVFHNKICPFGALQELTGRFARYSKKVDDNACIGCRKCEKVCPSQAIIVSNIDKKAKIDPKLCHQCENCQLVCPKDAIDFRIKK